MVSLFLVVLWGPPSDHRSGEPRTSGRRPPTTGRPSLETLMLQSLWCALRGLATKYPLRLFPIELCLHLCGDILIYEVSRQDARPFGQAATPKPRSVEKVN